MFASSRFLYCLISKSNCELDDIKVKFYVQGFDRARSDNTAVKYTSDLSLLNIRLIRHILLSKMFNRMKKQYCKLKDMSIVNN